MIARFFGSAIRLDLGNGRLRFRSPERLIEALAAHAAPSAGRVAVLGTFSGDTLAHELQGIRQVAQIVGRALAKSTETDDALSALLIEIDSLPVADHDGWHQILQRLARIGPQATRYQRGALQRYLEYLNATQELMAVLRDGRSFSSRASSDLAQASDPDLLQHQTLSYDLAAIANAHPNGTTAEHEEFNRMPKGETVEIEIGPHQSLSLLLARYPFVLISGTPFLLVDEYGNDLRLRVGKNIVGRSAQCDVAVDTALRAVSRRHMIVEADGDGPVRITDISTIGTFLPRGFLDNRLH